MIEKITKNLIDQAVKVLASGGVLVTATETAYGLAADATNKKAVERIYKIKGRSFKKFLPLILGSNCKVREYFKVNGKENRLLIDHKGLSIVLPVKNKEIYLLPGQETCAVRVSTGSFIRAIAKKLGRPITATSANKAGGGNCYSVDEVLAQIKESEVDMIIDGGKLKKKKPSTIVKVIGKEIKVLRQGEIKC
jgi:L-threonylcarbamoyladenylate synthase